MPMPRIDMPLFITPMISAPTTAPVTRPTPPEAEAPPMKQAAITSSSKPRPAFGVAVFRRAAQIRPASAARTPLVSKVETVSGSVSMQERDRTREEAGHRGCVREDLGGGHSTNNTKTITKTKKK